MDYNDTEGILNMLDQSFSLSFIVTIAGTVCFQFEKYKSNGMLQYLFILKAYSSSYGPNEMKGKTINLTH